MCYWITKAAGSPLLLSLACIKDASTQGWWRIVGNILSAFIGEEGGGGEEEEAEEPRTSSCGVERGSTQEEREREKGGASQTEGGIASSPVCAHGNPLGGRRKVTRLPYIYVYTALYLAWNREDGSWRALLEKGGLYAGCGAVRRRQRGLPPPLWGARASQDMRWAKPVVLGPSHAPTPGGLRSIMYFEHTHTYIVDDEAPQVSLSLTLCWLLRRDSSARREGKIVFGIANIYPLLYIVYKSNFAKKNYLYKKIFC